MTGKGKVIATEIVNVLRHSPYSLNEVSIIIARPRHMVERQLVNLVKDGKVKRVGFVYGLTDNAYAGF